MTRQLSLTFGNRHGGRRKGAGRKPKGTQAGVKHRPRADFARRKPVLVTQRIAANVPSLRRPEVLAIFRRLVVRYERHVQIYEAFFHIACLLITLRHL